MFKKLYLTSMIIALPAFLFLTSHGTSLTAQAAVTTTPVYLFLCNQDHDHFFTSSSEEKNQLCAYPSPNHYYEYQGEKWRVEVEPYSDNVPVYRFFNAVTYDHFYTISESEKNALAETLASGKDHYVYEGIAWYAHASGGVPVYRLFNANTFDHYYTIDPADRDFMISYMGYKDEGIGWYEQQTTSTSQNSGQNTNGSQGQNHSSGNSNGRGQSARSDKEIVKLLNEYLDQYDEHWYHSFNGEPEMDWGFSISVALYGNKTQDWYGYNNSFARQPSDDELWCFLDAAAGDGVLPIGNVYVNRYSGYVDASSVSNWNGADVPSGFWLW